MDTDSFMVQVKSEDIYTYLARGLKKRIETSKYELKNPLPIGKITKKDWDDGGRTLWMNNETGPKMYSNVTDDGYVNKKGKRTKKVWYNEK